ncbi:hypothetical protein J437_LFUL001608 [Ladona fulva]|uniref:Uncharacterized protein n=1 Tax=Ladona fulva TaxID=123851 RepID=A0A8K0KJE2_LADFU|nr:hypothetical protein J437_LFUL001608 [Ladona fulva]
MATVIHAEGSGSIKLGLTSMTHVSGAGMSRTAFQKLNLIDFHGDLKCVHSVKTCRRQNPCQQCPLRHHSLLHFTLREQDSHKAMAVKKVEGQVNTKSGYADGAVVTLTTPVKSVTDSSHDLAEGSTCAVLLSTAVGLVRDQYGNYQVITSIFGLAQTAVGVAHGKLTVVFEPTPKGGSIEVEAKVIESPKMEGTLAVSVPEPSDPRAGDPMVSRLLLPYPRLLEVVCCWDCCWACRACITLLAPTTPPPPYKRSSGRT